MIRVRVRTRDRLTVEVRVEVRVKVRVRAEAAGLGRTRGPARVERPAEEGLVRHGQTDGRSQFAPERAAGRYAVRHLVRA